MELEGAIESLENLKILFEIEDERDFEATPKQQRIIAQQIKVVLNHLTKQEKMIDLLIEDLQGEGCLNMTREEIGNYYERRMKLAEESE